MICMIGSIHVNIREYISYLMRDERSISNNVCFNLLCCCCLMCERFVLLDIVRGSDVCNWIGSVRCEHEERRECR